MDPIGNRLVLPLFDAELSTCDSIEICQGVSIFNLPNSYQQTLRSNAELIARYGRSLDYMKSGIQIETEKIPDGDQLNWGSLLELGIFISMSIRLATGVPVDVPYWFDMEDDEIKGYGNPQVSTYRTGHRYMYPLD